MPGLRHRAIDRSPGSAPKTVLFVLTVQSPTIEEIAHACGKEKRTGNGYVCLCPAHADHSASLDLSEEHGAILWHCKAGCSQERVLDALRAMGFFKNGKHKEPEIYVPPSLLAQATNGSNEILHYTYVTAEGEEVCRKCKIPKKKPEKNVYWQEHWDGAAWVRGKIDNPPLYNYPEFIAAIQRGEAVAVAEGEKDADRVTKDLGIACVTSIDGAPKWREEYNKEFLGAEVFVFYDNDKTENQVGQKRRDAIVAGILSVARKVVVCHLPDEFKDISDFLDAGRDPDKEINWEDVTSLKYASVDASEWLDQEYDLEPLIENLFDRGDKVAIIGKSKTRKSFFALQLVLCCATGRDFLTFPVIAPQRVLLVQYEIKEGHFHGRLKRACEAMGIEPDELQGKLFILNARGKKLTPEDLVREVTAVHADIVLIDPLYKIVEGDENSAEDMKPVLKWFDEIAEQTKAAVVYVHHDKKGFSGEQDLSDRGSGSSVIGRDFDGAFFLTPHEKGGDLVVLDTLLRNYAAHDQATLEWASGFFVRSTEAPVVKTARNTLKGEKKAASKIEDWFPAVRTIMKDGEQKYSDVLDMLVALGCSQRKSVQILSALVLTKEIAFDNRSIPGTRGYCRYIVPG